MRAFSLVELSIVLVILGLLTGGILAGQSLIHAAELRAFSSETSRYSSAIHGFRDKYFGLPGDITNAAAFWGKDNTNCSYLTNPVGTPGTCNGNGDGKIVWDYANGEDLRAWQQLAMAGLIEGSYAGYGEVAIGATVPSSKVAGGSGYMLYTSDWMGFATNHAAPGATLRLMYGKPRYIMAGMTFMTNAALKAEDAWNLDTKMDDGLPRTGKFTAVTGTGGSTSCDLPVSPFNYRLDSTDTNCDLIYAIY